MKQFLKDKFQTLYFFYTYIGYKLFILLVFSLLMVLMDTFGLTMFVPLLQIADGNVSEDQGQIVYYVIQFFQFIGLSLTVKNLLLFIIVLFSLKGVFFFYALRYRGVLMQIFSKKIRTNLAYGVRNLNYSQFIQTDVGRLQSTLTGESWQVANASSLYLDVIKNVIFLLVYLGFAFALDWKFSILVVIGGGLSNVLYSKFYKRTQELSRDILKDGHTYGAIVVEAGNHYKYLKATGRNINFFDRLKFELDKIIRNNIHVAVLSARLTAFREPMTITVILVVIAVHLFVFQSSLSGIMVILLLFYRAMQIIVDLQNGWNQYLSNIGTIENVQDFQKFLDEHSETYEGKVKFEGVEEISLTNIQLQYDQVQVLNDINLQISQNQSIAFVGESGSGKTSLVNVLSGLIRPTSGNISINKSSIEEIDINWYRSRIGYISQEPTVFNGTIFENVSFWDEATAENLEKFERVVDMCALRSFLNNLPEGYNALLGNNGVNISGGQKQRISIARELYRDVDILIMDEATAALDSETENEIRESLESLQGKVTIISIAHRLSTVKSADCLYLMEKGKIVASGDFEELKNKSTYFKRLTELQGM